jgi:hypothetical protein
MTIVSYSGLELDDTANYRIKLGQLGSGQGQSLYLNESGRYFTNAATKGVFRVFHNGPDGASSTPSFSLYTLTGTGLQTKRQWKSNEGNGYSIDVYIAKGPNYTYDESKGYKGAYSCQTSMDCSGTRTCSRDGWCNNEPPTDATNPPAGRSRFVAAVAPRHPFAILQLADTADTDVTFCGVTNFYDFNDPLNHLPLPDTEFLGAGNWISRGGVIQPGAWNEFWAAKLAPVKMPLPSVASTLWPDNLRNSQGSLFQLEFIKL